MDERFKVLVVRRETDGNQVWIKGRKETFAFFGWDLIYDEWAPRVHTAPDGSRFSYYGARTPRGGAGGQRLRISRAISKNGHPRGLVNCFRIHSHISNRDLAELAHFAGPQVAWMESKCGRRLDWEEWEAYYQGQTLPFHQPRFQKVA